MKQKTLSVKIDADLMNALDEEADEQGISRSDHVRDILRARNEASDVKKAIHKVDADGFNEPELDNGQSMREWVEQEHRVLSEHLTDIDQYYKEALDDVEAEVERGYEEHFRRLKDKVEQKEQRIEDLEREVKRLENHRDDLSAELEECHDARQALQGGISNEFGKLINKAYHIEQMQKQLLEQEKGILRRNLERVPILKRVL